MTIVTIQRAQTFLADLVARAEAGEEIVLSRGDEPAVRLTPVPPTIKPIRMPGAFKGQFTVPEDFFDPLSEEELCLWEDGPIVPPDKNE